MKKWWFIIIALVLVVGFANAFSKAKSLEWLNKSIDYQSSSIEESSFTLLALKSSNYITSNDAGLILFQQRKDDSNCYPINSCNTRDTALAVLTYSAFNINYNDLITWIESAKTKANVEDWYIQIHSTGSGDCTIIYDQDREKTVTLDGTNKLRINNRLVDWVSVKNDLGANLDQPVEEILVDCTYPAPGVNDPGMIISLLRITANNEFYIYQESQGRQATLIINNACYSNAPGGQCDKEASFYTAWVFKRLGRTNTITPYLQKNAANNKDYAMLLSITQDQSYAQLLADNQNPLGHWDNNIITTSFAYNALKPYSQYNEKTTKARTWLENKQIVSDPQNNGSYGDVINTAVPLYLVFTEGIGTPPSGGGGAVAVCGNGFVESGEQCDDGNVVSGDNCSSTCQIETSRCTSDLDCSPPTPICNTITGVCQSSTPTPSSRCGDNICSTDENIINCAMDCSTSGTSPECTSNSQCPSGKICQQGQCVLGCASDDDCESGKCDLETNTCIEKKGLGAVFWASLVIIIAILAIGGYLAYNKFFKKQKPSEPSFLGGRPVSPRQPPKLQYQPRQVSKRSKTDEALERELDRSIKEAERLLKR